MGGRCLILLAYRQPPPESHTVLARRSLPPLLAASLLLAVAGTAGTLDGANAADQGSGTTTGTTAGAVGIAPRIKSAAAGETAWKLGDPVEVVVTGGTLVSASLTDRAGRQVRGRLEPTAWESTGGLVPRTTYVLDATAVAPDGQQTVLHDTVRTGKPPKVLRATVSPNGRTVGVGRPLVVTFNHDVRRKADVEAALHATTTKDVGLASWSWTSSRTIQYRPQTFWPGYTRVSLTADLRKVHAGPGLWGMKDADAGFRIGRKYVMRVSNAKHRLVLRKDGVKLRTFGVSMGKPGFPTRSGTKVIMDIHESYRMRSTTVGITGDEAYDLDVPYAMRITASGEFLHGAPWNHYIGVANKSHGCTNLTLSDAHWLFNRVREGDPVVTTGTGRSTESWNGLGGVWNIPWTQWVKGSALS
jgi:lipoprotein-anchoring transpeptidase ErfK/SrfK